MPAAVVNLVRPHRSKHPHGTLVVGLQRVLAINILAVLRALSRIRRSDRSVKLTWMARIEAA